MITGQATKYVTGQALSSTVQNLGIGREVIISASALHKLDAGITDYKLSRGDAKQFNVSSSATLLINEILIPTINVILLFYTT